MLGVGVKGGDGLTVDTCRSGVGPDLGPGQGQIGGIGDGLQHLAHETSPPCSLSPSPHTRALDRPPVPSSRSAVRVCSCGSGGIGVRFEAWSRSAPSPVTGGPLGPPGRPPTWWRWVSGHYPAFRTTTNRLTPRRASVCLSLRVIASPTRPPPIRRPGHRWTTGHPISRARRRMRGLLGTLRGLAGSPRQQCRRGPPKITCWSPHASMVVPKTWGHRLPCSRAGRHFQTAFYRFTARSSLRLRLRPLRTPRHRDALGIGYRTSTTKAQEGLSPPCRRNCKPYRETPPPGGGGDLGLWGLWSLGFGTETVQVDDRPGARRLEPSGHNSTTTAQDGDHGARRSEGHPLRPG